MARRDLYAIHRVSQAPIRMTSRRRTETSHDATIPTETRGTAAAERFREIAELETLSQPDACAR